MHPAEIKSLIEISGYTQAQIAKELNVHPSAVYLAIKGESGLPRIREKIAQIVKKSVKELWPPKVPAETA
jgi:predicted transcriptional regulator